MTTRTPPPRTIPRISPPPDRDTGRPVHGAALGRSETPLRSPRCRSALTTDRSAVVLRLGRPEILRLEATDRGAARRRRRVPVASPARHPTATGRRPRRCLRSGGVSLDAAAASSPARNGESPPRAKSVPRRPVGPTARQPARARPVHHRSGRRGDSRTKCDGPKRTPAPTSTPRKSKDVGKSALATSHSVRPSPAGTNAARRRAASDSPSRWPAKSSAPEDAGAKYWLTAWLTPRRLTPATVIRRPARY